MDTALMNEDVLAGLMGGATGFAAGSTLAEGRDIERIAEINANEYLIQSRYVGEDVDFQARRLEEGFERSVARQTVRDAASGIVVNTGASLVNQAEAKRLYLEDKGRLYTVAQRQQRELQIAAIGEKAKGKAAKRRSIWDAISLGLGGAASIAKLGQEGTGGGGSSAVNISGSSFENPQAVFGSP